MMPELPEMENYRLLLSPLVINKRINQITVTREKTINLEVNLFNKEVQGHSIVSIERRAKHLLFVLDTGSVLLLHLMLGGSMFYGKQAPERTAQVILHFADSNSLYFLGLRLGYLHLHSTAAVKQVLKKLGPEPLDPAFGFDGFLKVIIGRRTNLKLTLVDQSVMSGIGNCYSDEICFIAQLLPTRRVNTLSGEEQKQLFKAMQTVLREAVHYGGYMDAPLYDGDRLTGQFDPMCRVYDRGGEPCQRCGNPLIHDEVSSKKCFYCLNCQK
jgi:formamidopyrimidine-DNA glycosylase